MSYLSGFMRLRGAAALIVGALALSALGVVAFAADGGTITACVKKGNGDVRFVSSASECKHNETVTTFNQTGPAGPPGSAGPPGPAGPSTAGPAGLDLIVVTSNVQNAGGPDGSITGANVICPADHPYATGGGGQSFHLGLAGSEPVAYGHGWVAIAVPGGGPTTVFAICSK
jgi:hypothetical protein